MREWTARSLSKRSSSDRVRARAFDGDGAGGADFLAVMIQGIFEIVEAGGGDAVASERGGIHGTGGGEQVDGEVLGIEIGGVVDVRVALVERGGGG